MIILEAQCMKFVHNRLPNGFWLQAGAFFIPTAPLAGHDLPSHLPWPGTAHLPAPPSHAAPLSSGTTRVDSISTTTCCQQCIVNTRHANAMFSAHHSEWPNSRFKLLVMQSYHNEKVLILYNIILKYSIIHLSISYKPKNKPKTKISNTHKHA